MRFLVGKCTGPAVVSWLRGQNHDVFSVFDEARGYPTLSSWLLKSKSDLPEGEGNHRVPTTQCSCQAGPL